MYKMCPINSLVSISLELNLLAQIKHQKKKKGTTMKMAKAEVSSLLFLLVTILPLAAQGSRLYSWANQLEESGKDKVTNLQFYFHDTLSGKNPTAVKVAQAADTDKSPTLFGSVFMIDDALTETADPKSKLVGRAQGLYGSSCNMHIYTVYFFSYGMK